MKNIKALYLGMAMAAAAATLTSCQADMDAPALVEPKATMEANTTISEFKTAFADQTVKCPMKDEATQTPYIIHGRVVSSDATGNIYKSIVIQDETAAIALSVNQGSTYTDYRIGQDVVLNATGLYIGYYNGLQQIGWLDEYNGAPSLTFMAWDFFLAHSELNGFPNPDVKYVAQDAQWPADAPYCIVTTFSQLPSTGEAFRNMQSQLVEFRNVHFEEGGKETYAPYQESVNRTLVDANGGTLTVRTSGYSNFYNELIPEGSGNVRGILSYYGDGWQLLLRGLGDVMITEKGQKNDPYTVEEAMDVMDQGASGWVKGFIVGSVKGGVNDVTSNNDVIFGTDAEMDNNILIAASADETDWTKCIAVELPQGSAFRAAVNLVDNPGVLGKSIIVRGDLAKFLGMPGITGNGGTAADVEVEGVTIGGGTPAPGPGEGIPAGDGTQESPFNPDQVKAQNDATGVWLEGYVVGYVADKTWDSAVFGTEASDGDNYKNATNVILSMVAPAEANASNSVPVGLKNTGDVRTTLGISKNPSIYGARVKVKGDLKKYFGMKSVRDVTEYVIVDGSGDTPAPPSTGETTVYSSLEKTLTALPSDWTIDNVTLPAGKTELWSWKMYNDSGYLNATGYGATSDGLSYAISPVIDLTGYTSAKVSFRHAAKFQTTIKQLCGFVVREAGSSAWTELTIQEWPPLDNKWTFVSSGEMDLSAFAGKKIQVAFKYGCSAAGADQWEINDLEVKASR